MDTSQRFRVAASVPLAPDVRRIDIEAPLIAAAWQPGQFVIVRPHDTSERIPLTINDVDHDSGVISLVVQGIGRTTRALNDLAAGEHVHDVAGPLGTPTEIRHFGTVVVVGGGVGTAIAYPVARAMAEAGNHVVAIIGGRDAKHVILEDELRAAVTEVYPCTDDGSLGYHGFVTGKLAELIDGGLAIDLVLAVGPIPMMAAVAETTRPAAIPTTVSLNPIMVDGTGMCGGCRVTVGGVTRFACVDGPEFDAHQVDFVNLAQRNRAYADFECRQAAVVAVPGVAPAGLDDRERP